MATNSLHSLHRHLTNLLHHTDSTATAIPLFSSTFFPKPTAATSSLSLSLSTTTAFSSITSTTPSTSQPAAPSTSLDLLRRHLEAREYRQADDETRRLLIALAGEPAVARGYVFFSEVQFIPTPELRAVDELWKEHSEGRFGYSVQKKIWKKKAKMDFTNFFIKVGWMKKLPDSEVEQYNYRAFPAEFIWELNEDTPEGHLPLTNALRGTQLLNSVLNHPAFEGDADESDDDDDLVEQGRKRIGGGGDEESGNKVFKTDYSF
ncbi:unnamed protein product [Linum tenue]|uniref:GUN4-like domain-containing protein n=1 Tax=Linum tenue TaxID=586396 RepID=A0AAV0LFR2_9ROSI|nr:unnamed protein product [Linum tenue]